MIDSGAEHLYRHTGGSGAVVLDIGGDVGALVVRMPAWMCGTEIEISPAPFARDGTLRHAAVVLRPTEVEMVPSLVFDGLRAGRYALSVRPDGPVRLTADVSGGRVTTAEWPS